MFDHAERAIGIMQLMAIVVICQAGWRTSEQMKIKNTKRKSFFLKEMVQLISLKDTQAILTFRNSVVEQKVLNLSKL